MKTYLKVWKCPKCPNCKKPMQIKDFEDYQLGKWTCTKCGRAKYD